MNRILAWKLGPFEQGHSDLNGLMVKWLSLWIDFFETDNTVCIQTGYGLGGRGTEVHFSERARFFSSPLRPDRLQDTPTLLSKE
jgi:hypothetical protein